MADVLMLAIMCAFFALALLFVKGCEKIIGPDIAVVPATDDESVAEAEAA